MSTKELKLRLKSSFDFAKEHNEDLDARSWGYEQGAIISQNEAILFIKLIDNEAELRKENDGWIKIESEADLPKTFQEVNLYREDAGVFVGYYGSLAESIYEMEVENHYNNEVSEETIWKEQFFYFGLEGNGILEGSEAPTHWKPLPEPPKF